MHLHFRNINDTFTGVLGRLTGKTMPVTKTPRYPGHIPLIHTKSRNGPVLQITEPLTITYCNPWERVLFNPIRNCNPFFHFAEALWMLAGMDDTATIIRYNKRMAEFSDDGETFWGAYGYRWRYWFQSDQIMMAVKLLKEDPSTRRVVIGIWDPSSDLIKQREKCSDLPCNTHLYLQIVEDELVMTVCNRSNDIMWGMLGANAFHFSFLQEYIATLLECKIGALHQFSTNPHLYEEVFPQAKLEEMLEWQDNSYEPSPYMKDIDSVDYTGPWYPEPMFSTPTKESANFITHAIKILDDPFIPHDELGSSQYLIEIASPILRAWEYHKKRDYDTAIGTANLCTREDYRLACIYWLGRTETNYQSREELGVYAVPKNQSKE